MASVELVVTLPDGWGEDRGDLAAALAVALDRFPGVAVAVRAADPGLLAQVDRLRAGVRDTAARLAEAEARMRWLRSPWGPARLWGIGFATGAAAALAGVALLR